MRRIILVLVAGLIGVWLIYMSKKHPEGRLLLIGWFIVIVGVLALAREIFHWWCRWKMKRLMAQHPGIFDSSTGQCIPPSPPAAEKITFECPQCRQHYSAPPAMEGTDLECLGCGTSFHVGGNPRLLSASAAKYGLWIAVVLLFIGGVAGCYFGIYGPIREMERGVPKVIYSSWGFCIGPILLGMCVLVPFFVSSDRKNGADPSGDVPRWLRVFMTVLMVAIGAGTAHWFNNKAKALGYRHGSLVSEKGYPPPPRRNIPLADFDAEKMTKSILDNALLPKDHRARELMKKYREGKEKGVLQPLPPPPDDTGR